MRLQSTHVLLIFCVAMVLAGNSFLTSAGQGEEDGAVSWSADSVLRPLVETLNLRYAFPTPLGVEVKSWVFGAGTAVAMLIAALGWYLGVRGGPADGKPLIPVPPVDDAPNTRRADSKPVLSVIATNMSAATGAQLMFAILLVYSLVSANWSFAAEFSLAGSAVLGAHIGWALALGRGLNLRAARICSRILIVVCVLTALLAVWYFHERNPHFRAKYPIGNPLFLAAVLLPAIILSISEVLGGLTARGEKPNRRWAAILAGSAALVVLMWAFSLTGGRPPADAGFATKLKAFALAGSRASMIGLVMGLLAIPFFRLGKRGKIALLTTAGIVAMMIVAFMIPRWQEVSEFGRGATVRLRLYAWSYAVRMVEQRSLTGLGQGGYTLLADSAEFAGRDALADPLAMQGRLAHAHNEWIETWADLGTLGLAFLVSAYLLTFVGGVQALRRMQRPGERWCLIGLLAALFAMGVEEFASVGLRLPGVPAVYYTVLGLIWSMSRVRERDTTVSSMTNGWESFRFSSIFQASILIGVIVAALTVMGLYARDWAGARAQHDSIRSFAQGRYDQAIVEAENAAATRLKPNRRLEAKTNLAEIYARTAETYVLRAQQRLERAKAGEIAQDWAQKLAADDHDLATGPMDKCLKLTESLQRFAPGIRGIGSIEADVCLLLAERARFQGKTDSLNALQIRAVRALKNEVLRYRSDEQLVVRYLSTATGLPVPEQIELLCGPLRGGTAGSALNTMAEQLARQDAFISLMGALLAQAEKDLATGDPQLWKNDFSPEVCRLAAALEGRHNNYEQAAQYCERAVRLYEQGRNREFLSLARAQTLLTQAWYVFLSKPTDPEAATRLTEEAIKAVPPVGKAELYRAGMWSQHLTLQIAADDEESARAVVRDLSPDIDDRSLDERIARHHTIVADLFRARGVPGASDHLDRAMQLAPDSVQVRRGHARRLFFDEMFDELAGELFWLLDHDEPRRVADFAFSILSARPDAVPIREFCERMQNEGRLPVFELPSIPTTLPADVPAEDEESSETAAPL